MMAACGGGWVPDFPLKMDSPSHKELLTGVISFDYIRFNPDAYSEKLGIEGWQFRQEIRVVSMLAACGFDLAVNLLTGKQDASDQRKEHKLLFKAFAKEIVVNPPKQIPLGPLGYLEFPEGDEHLAVACGGSTLPKSRTRSLEICRSGCVTERQRLWFSWRCTGSAHGSSSTTIDSTLTPLTYCFRRCASWKRPAFCVVFLLFNELSEEYERPPMGRLLDYPGMVVIALSPLRHRSLGSTRRSRRE
ncbi:hypothetical protein F5B20DRAFT_562912 [Whalleya microplaca]|nr:hypothetical protein F5B20DRAFT_562912 [Whalleya microplaca]